MLSLSKHERHTEYDFLRVHHPWADINWRYNLPSTGWYDAEFKKIGGTIWYSDQWFTYGTSTRSFDNLYYILIWNGIDNNYIRDWTRNAYTYLDYIFVRKTAGVEPTAIVAPLQAPEAVAEPGIDANSNLILDGSQSSDLDGTIVSWEWTLINRDPAGNNFTLTGETASTETVDVGIYDITLTVTDNDGLTGTDTMMLAVAGICTEYKPMIDQIMSTLGVTDPNEIVSSIVNLQNEVAALNNTITDLQAQVTSLNETITDLQGQLAILGNINAGLQNQVAAQNAIIASLEDQINALINALSTGLGNIGSDFQITFKDPYFAIPGASLPAKFQSLSQAILGLNKGRKEGVYVNLGGKPGK